ncbi:MAG: hypothetical protein AMJ62_02530 [Myxococcales bacterium SG8_38]|nr:MAG: hypothetical protein AMJ62_02530 [Myxococcales bacterium SG8_38]
MGQRWGILLCIAVCHVATLGALPVDAQTSTEDAAAREYFERGRTAFQEADYEGALVYFRHAYRLSQRSELQYNIGVAADRLQREEEAVEAFERYLEETEQPAREAEVRERIAALRRSIEERDATKRALEEAAVRYEPAGPKTATVDGARIKTSAIAGSTALAAAGAAGVAAMGIGLARDGSCAREIGGRCVTEHSSTAWTWVYGGLGVAALAGSAAWLSVSAKRQKNAHTTRVSITPTGVRVTGTF